MVQGKASVDGSIALICPIYKKKNPQNCSNYRGIPLLNATYKVLTYCILDKVEPIAESVLDDHQGGFRFNRSTTDQMFIIRQIIQKCLEYNKDVYILFIDLKKNVRFYLQKKPYKHT